MNILEVPTPELIKLIKNDFKEKLTQPEFTLWIKTGAHRERIPQQSDWWYLRTASILYRVYRDGPVGTERLRTYYGGRKNRGVKPEKFVKSSGKIIRTCFQALEKEKLIKKEKKGRIISKEGQKYLNEMAKKLSSTLKKEQIIKPQQEKEIKKSKEKTETKIIQKNTETKEIQKPIQEKKQKEIIEKPKTEKKQVKEKPQEKKEKK